MKNETGYEGEDWGNSQAGTTNQEDNSVMGEMLIVCKESFTTAFFSTVVFFSIFLIGDVYYEKISDFLISEETILFGTLLIACAIIWSSHRKRKVEDILEFKEPTIGKN